MNHRPCSDVGAYVLIGMTQTWQVFLCPAFSREPEYVIDGKNEVRHIHPGSGKEILWVRRLS